MHWLTGQKPAEGDEQERYREAVRASWPVGVVMLSALTASAWAAFDRSPSSASAGWDAWADALPLWVLTLVLVLVLHWFLDLEVEVRDRTLALRFGPVERELDAEELVDVAVEPYDWRPYAKRDGTRDAARRRAFTAPFVRSGVVVITSDGTRYDVASRRPEALQAAVVGLIEDHGGYE